MLVHCDAVRTPHHHEVTLITAIATMVCNISRQPQGGPPKASKTVHKVPLHRTAKQASPVASLIKGLLPILVIVLAVLYALYKQ